MAQDVAKGHNSEIVEFNPERHRLTVAALDYGIEEAKRIKDWPKLETAVDAKIAEQRKFVAWWDREIQPAIRPKKSPGTRLLSVSDAESLTGMKHQRVSELGRKLEAGDNYRTKLLGAGYRAALLADEHNHRAQGSGENEWYTPEKYIEMARQVLGDIDLDPATSEHAQKIIQAKQYFTAGKNGLKQAWHGRVWLNPPYSQPLIYQFVEKMVEEHAAGNVVAGIMLTHNYTDTAWFHKGCETATAICFPRGRIKFLDKDGGECAPTQGQAFFYFGTDSERFCHTFINIGVVFLQEK